MGLLSSLFGGNKQNEQPSPSWATNKHKMKEFVSTLRELAKHQNIPDRFLQGVLTDEYGMNRILTHCGTYGAKRRII
jgi:MFS-type transporter involved in bile tolerance (Atg22 family)